MNTLEQRLILIEQALKTSVLASKMVLTFIEAAEFTGLSRSYLYKLTCKQKIPHYKPSGKLLFFKREELQTWLLQNRIKTIDEISSQAQIYCMNKGGKK